MPRVMKSGESDTLQAHFQGRKPALLIIMDGWGIGSGGPEDAVAQANTPTLDRLWDAYPHTQLLTHGPYVGLSSAKDLGGSEVGHLTMGAGNILDQGPTRINKAIANGSFYQSPALQKVIMHCLQQHSTLHLLGLLSDGNVHSHIDHFLAVIRRAHDQGIARLRLHALFDGRDVGIRTAQGYVVRIEEVFDAINQKQERDYRVASAGGREVITMDRDHDWRKVEAGWQAHVHGQSENKFQSASEAIDFFRNQTLGLVDQDMPGFVVVDKANHPVGAMEDHDAVIMMNFRGDRAIEITEAFCLNDFDGFDRGERPNVLFAGMMVYDEDRNLPALQIMGPTRVDNPFGKRIFDLGIRQFRLTETQKFPHVTFFFNGGRREPLDPAMEEYIMIPSDKGVSFADTPAMKACEIADKAVELIGSGEYGFGLINFANVDMVGHCGRIEPAIAAVEVVDTAIGRIVAALEACGGSALITADHGNAEEMLVHTSHGDEPCTRHSINPVPCILFDPRYDGSYHLRQPQQEEDIGMTPGLSHLAATLFMMLGMDSPEDMNPPLIVLN
ncbi:MAG: 2,3-bisphosphoglycerate-independent phosphoglycerate mutase [Zetaproteobacteria bacterium]|nr:MAG: 2,3-bisphosphoglycerate-independent phosphoglycerate mutase [Zetaproteobacteria bacterium]